MKKKSYYELILENIHDGIILVNQDARSIVLVNAAFIRQTGIKKSHALSQSVYTLAAVNDNRWIQDVFNGTMKYGHVHFRNIHVHKKNGLYFSADISGSRIELDNQTYILFTIREITEREKSEKTLIESEERFHQLFNNIKSCVAIYRAENNGDEFIFVDLNKSGEIHSKVKAEDIRGKRVTDVFPGVVDIGLFDVFKRVYRTGKPESLPMKLYQDNRIKEWVENYVLKLPSGLIVAIYEDTSQQRIAEMALKESEAKYRSLVDSAAQPIFTVDESGVFLFMNDFSAKILGGSPDGFIGKTMWDLFPKEMADGQMEHIGNALASGKMVSAERKSLVAGREMWFSAHIQPLKNRDGDYDRVLVMLTDITKQKEYEEVLKISEARYRALFENLQLGFALRQMIFDDNGNPVDYEFIDVNRTYEIQTGAKKSEVVGKKITEIMPDIRNDQVNWLERYGEVVKTGKPIFFEYYSEDIKKWHYVVAYRPQEGQFATLFTDITARKEMEKALEESEEKYRLAMQATTDGLWDWNVETGEVYYSPAWVVIVEEKEVQPGYQTWETRIHPDDKEHVLTSIRNHLNGQTTFWRCEHRLRTRRGAWKWVLGRGQVVDWSDSGAAVRMIGTMTDISDRKRTEEEKEKLEEQLQQSRKLEAVGTLAGGIAHEFNNILGVIIGYAEISTDDLPPEHPVAENLNQILSSCKRAKEMVQQILAFSRKNQKSLKVVNTAKVMKEAIKFLRSTIPTTIDIQTRIDEDSGMVMANETQLYQVLINLCANATHAMREQGGVLNIELKKERPSVDILASKNLIPGIYQQLTVSDTGEGMNDDVISRIFEPYFTTKQVGEGTGMGMAVVYGIVKEYGGDITVDSSPGQGSTVQIYLPIVGEDSNISNGDKIIKEIPLGNQERILFVDVQPELVELGNLILESLSYRVTTFCSSRKALQFVKDNPRAIDLVITDMTMPHLTGLQMVREMHKINPGLPVILCTGYSDQINEDNFQSQGIHGFVMKPMVKADIAIKIREVLEMRL